jgi:hypothetical protein
MTRNLSVVLVMASAVAMVLQVVGGPLARAQPVATIALPEPGGVKELYTGCNLLALTFPDGTASEEVIDAVTPPEAVQALWRQTLALDRFEGFSPPFPQASDLLTVNFLEPVWFCTPRLLGPPPSPTPTPAPAGAPATPTPTPAPAPLLTADLAITELFLQSRPQGNVIARLKNNGPDTLSNVTVELSCGTLDVVRYDGSPAWGQGFEGPLTVSLSPGQTADFPTALSVDISQAAYVVSCTVEVTFADSDLTNNVSGRVLALEADLAVTDIFPDSLPQGSVFTRITNNGPDSLANTTVLLGCSYVATTSTLQTWTKANAPSFTTVSLNPGETKEFDVKMSVDNSCTKYDVTCEVQVAFYDANKTNNSYSETIPMWSGGGFRCPY